MSTVLTCPNCGATSEIGAGIESGQFICAKCKSTVGFGPGTTALLAKTEVRDELTGRTLGGYEVQKLLGVGGMGRVYLARQISINRPVALKILASNLAENENFTKRFIREAQAAGRLLHQNLVTVFDAGKEDNIYFFSMEFVKGEPVSKLIFEKGSLPANEALAIVRQVAEALNCAFEHGIIHRDIKPDNIMITPSGLVKLADLGLAKQIEGESPESGLTLAGSVMGTPHYLAPEQARDSKAVDQRADVYSLGCTFYHMLTGNVPFSGSSTYEILRKHEIEEPVFPAECAVPGPVQALVKRMMAKEAADRPQTPDEVLRAIDEIARGESPAVPVAASLGSMPTEEVPGMPTPTPVGPTEPAGMSSVPATEPAGQPKRKSRFKRVLVIAGIVILVLIVLSTIVGDKRWQAAEREYQQAQQYAKEHPDDFKEIERRYKSIATRFSDMEAATKATQALAFEEVRRYAKENPQDTEGILQRYNDVAAKYEGTEAAARAKEAILDITIKKVEESLVEDSGSEDKLLLQLKQIQEMTSDQEFASNIARRMEGIKQRRQQGIELNFRRFKDSMEKLLQEGKYDEAKSRVELYVKDKGLTVIPVLVQKFTEKTIAMAQLEQLASGYYKAMFKKDWNRVAKHIDPTQINDEKKKKGLEFLGNILITATRAKGYGVTRIEVNLSEGTASIQGKMTVTARLLGGRTEEREQPVTDQAVRHGGKWYIHLKEKQPRQPREKEDKPKRLPRRPRRSVPK
jgi:serine/threonine protein kinase